MQNNHIRIGWPSYGEIISDATQYNDGGRVVLNAFYNRMQIGDIVLSCYSSKTIDAIGVITGEPEWHDNYPHYKRLRKVNWLVKDINEDIVALNGDKSMTLSTVYQLSVSVNDVMQILRKTAPQLFNSSISIPNRVFIIDEINRGNISKILGELITLLEPSRRIGAIEELKVKLPYSNHDFGIPDNVYVIGTMNTADRSIAMMDTALRRRFSFIEMAPDFIVLEDIEDIMGISVSDILRIMNQRITILYDREHTIGHSFFIPLKNNPTMEKLADIFDKKIIPLLQEYFYDDYEKIQQVLGDNQKSDESIQFIKKNSVNTSLFGNADIDITEYFEINHDAFMKVKSYEFLQ
jgi:5-methylcytosine-specific restriction protein B